MPEYYFSLHPAQQDVYMDQLLNVDSPQYNIGGYIVLKGNLHKEKFHAAVNSAPCIFDSFKMRFDPEEKDLTFCYDEDYNKAGLTEIDFSDRIDPALDARTWMQERFNIAFKLKYKTEPFEQFLIKITDQEHWFFGKYHHLITDGYGFIIYVQYVASKYNALLAGDEFAFAYPRYEEAAISANEYYRSAGYQEDGKYWNEKIPVKPEKLLQKKYAAYHKGKASETFTLPINETQRAQLDGIQQLCNAGLQQLTIAALLIYFGKISAFNEFIFGTPIHKRASRQLRNTVGMFSGILPFTGNYNKEQTLAGLLKEITATQRNNYRHQNYLIGDLSRDLKINFSEGYLCEVHVNYEPLDFELNFGEDITANIVRLANEDEHHPLQLCWRDYGKQSLELQIQFGYAYFNTREIELLARHVLFILDQFPKSLEQRIDSIAILTEQECNRLNQINCSQVAYPKEKNVVTLFEERFKKNPEGIAVIFEQKQLTYRELNERSNILASILRHNGVKEDVLVPLYTDRNLDMIVGILGILKAGGAYVPIDTAFPQERISYMLDDTRSAIAVSTSEFSVKLQSFSSRPIQVIELDGIEEQPGKSLLNRVQSSNPDHLAYVIYTSGSTGVPKGVQISHRNLTDYVYGLDDSIKISDCKSFALVSSIATDLGNTVLYSSLLFGGALHIFASETVSDIALLHKYFEEQRIDCVKIVPSHWKALTMDGQPLIPKKLLIFGGEALQVTVVETILNARTACRIVNHYGPTETTIGKLLHEIDLLKTYDQAIPLGKPFSNTQVYVLTKDLLPCPVGVPGQLYISGDGLSRGYVGNEELTRAKFIANPFVNGSAMYQTGDLVYYNTDGDIVFIGRADDQVKIRGYRVEPGEVARILEVSDLVKQAAVISREDRLGNKQLVAYIVAKGLFDVQAIQSYLKEKLPDYMMPSRLVPLDKLPLTANGKIDRRALPDVGESLQVETYIAPRNKTEAKLAAIWQEVLGVETIGIHDNFFNLGGHSLLAMRMVSAIRRELGVDIAIKDILLHPSIALLTEQFAFKTSEVIIPGIEVAARPDHIPLSFSQERLWFIDRLEGSVQYHMPAIIRLKGEINREALDHAFRQIIGRHEILRTVILEDTEGWGYQQVMPVSGWSLVVENNSYYKKDKLALEHHIKELITAPFDLSADCMLRANLVSVDEENHVLIITIHHIASDGWSRAILVKEVVEIYDAYIEGKKISLPDLPIQYADFAIWQRRYLTDAVLENKLEYWKSKLAGVSPLELPTDYPRPSVLGTKGASLTIAIDHELSAQLQSLSNQHGTTLFMTLLSAFNVLLYRYSGQEDICIAIPEAGRRQQEIEGLIGLFVNTLAIRSQVTGNKTFVELLEEVKTTTLEAYSHQEVPFEKVVDAVVEERDMSRSPLSQVLFVFQNTPEVAKLSLGNTQLLLEEGGYDTSKNDLTVTLTATPQGINGSIQYNTDLYKQETIRLMLGHFKLLLGSIITSPSKQIGLLEMLTPSEEHKLFVEFNDTAAIYPKDETIITLIEEQAKKTPGRTAIIFGEEQLSYSELNERSNKLAHYLQKRGVTAETLVPICIERGLEMIVGLLGILKAGAAYVPIDPNYPQDRINYMLEDTGAHLLLGSRSCRLKVGEKATIIELDGDWPLIDIGSPGNLTVKPSPGQLAYVIYTSGSTGTPKGVMVEHQNTYSFIAWCQEEFSSTDFSIVYATTSICFDLSVFELFYPLSTGKPVRMLENGLSITNYLPYDKAVLINTVPSVIQNLLNEQADFGNVSAINMAGEPISSNILDRLDTKAIRVRNLYGPTEDTTYSTNYILEEGKPALIGKPVSNTQIFILRGDKELVPLGMTGEICIGGAGLARGYLNQIELTQEKFTSNPFGSKKGARLYHTGDLGRWLPDGNIEYQGRLDDQVKIRGFRIELGEIESVLDEIEQIAQGVVLAKEDNQGNKRLVGYVVASGAFDKQAIQEYLSSKLPDYMVPALWIELESLPLTSNGKINRKALPDPELADITAEYMAPRNGTEQALAGIWQELLGVERAGIHDNFFKLGGHSLLAMRVVSAIRRKFNVELNIRELFIHPDIAGLGAHLDKQNNGSLLPKIIAGDRPEHIPLSFSQERLWFIDQFDGSERYHITAVLRLPGNLKPEILADAFQVVILRHEVLRTVIREDSEGNAYQEIISESDWALTIEDCVKENKAIIDQRIGELTKAPFDLSRDYMLRVNLIKVGKEEHVLAVTMHHIASDGWSIPILIKEVVELYAAYAEGREAQLPNLPVQYADYSIWQRKYLRGELLDKKLQYWKTKLNNVSPLELPTDYSRLPDAGISGASLKISIGTELSAQLQSFSVAHGASLYMTLLSALNVLLYRYSNQEDICVGTPVAGRQQEEVEGLIGFFINTLALRSQVNGNMSFTGLLEEVKTNMLEAYAYQEVPFEKVVDAVVKDRDRSRSPLFQVMFIFKNVPDVTEMRLGDVVFSPEETNYDSLKYDLTFTLTATAQGLSGTLQYNTNLYKAETIRIMLTHFEELLESITATPDQSIGSLKMLSQSEETALLSSFNATSADYGKDKNLVDLFEEQAAKTPDKTAVIYENSQLTYAELDEKSNQLARYLQKQGIKAETLVPICIERSLEMIVGILGILKAGGAYVPVDPEYPQDRIRYMLEDTGAKLALSNAASKSKLRESKIKVITLDGDWEQISKEPSTATPAAKPEPGNLAYMIYTSGSTGRPKGAMNEHGGIVNRLQWTQDYFKLTGKDAILQKTTFSFDVSVWELFWPIITGARLVFAKPGGQADSGYLKAIIKKENITLLHFVPSMLTAFLSDVEPGDCKSVENVLCSGEALTAAQVQLFEEKLPHVQLHNLYGPTEAAIDVSCWSNTGKEEKTKSIPIGKPVANTRLYILNQDGQLSPVGVPGELYIGGIQVGRGYLNKPELTAEKFINDPFSNDKKARLYKTGDLARWQADGNIDYLGRIDDQVKIRGYRIELGEIESVLLENEAISQGVVLAKEDGSGNKRLVGYVVPVSQFDKQAIQTYLKEKLPEYMVPAIWVELESIPLTPNGKTDRKALPDPELTDSTVIYAAPRNETEQALANTWQDLLGLEKVGINDNFFELGGDSILTIQVVSRMRRLGHTIQPKDIFNYQTIAALCGQISTGTANTIAGEQGELSGTFGLLPIQAWYLEKEQNNNSHFNQSVLLKISKSVTQKQLQAALDQLLSHHDALRLSFEKKDGNWQQTYSATSLQLSTDDLKNTTKANLAKAITARAGSHQQSLDISTGQLMRMALMETPESEAANRLFIVIHHLAVDGVSWRILLEDLEQLLSAITKGEQPQPTTKGSSYRQWQAALVNYGHSKKLQEQENYWQQVTNNKQPLPEDQPYTRPVQVKDIENYHVKLSAEQTRQLLQEAPRAYHTEISDLLLGALAGALCSWSGKDHAVIGLEGHGRETIAQKTDITSTVGWFTSLYPVLLEKETDPDKQIRSTKETLRNIPDKGLGYGVLKYSNKAESLQGADPWDIIFNYLGQLDTAASGQWLSPAPEDTGSNIAAAQAAVSKLGVNSYITGGELVIRWQYSSKHYNRETISKVAEDYHKELQKLIAHSLAQARTETIHTPSDYGLNKEISYKELDKFLEEDYNNRPIKEQLESLYRLSGLQQGMLFHGLYDNSGSYIEQVGCDLAGADQATLLESWAAVIKKHSILRSAFYYDTFNIPVQAVFKTVTLPVQELDYSKLDKTAQEQAVKAYETQDRTRGFDFKTAPLMRLTLIRLSNNRYRMLWTSHHLLFDGWSLPVLIEEFLNTYEQLHTGQNIKDTGQDQYEDYIRYLEQKDKQAAETYWRGYLKELEQGTLLPFIKTTAERTKGKGTYGTKSLTLGEAATAKVQSYTQANRITVNTLMQGIWAILLSKYTNSSEVVYGIIVSGRPAELANIEQRVGMYINTLALRAAVKTDQPTAAWLQKLQAEQVASREYQYTALQEVQAWTGIKGDLFDSLLIFENYPVSKLVESGNWSLQVENVEVNEQTNYPLTVTILIAEELSIGFNYNTELLEPAYVTHIRDQFEQVLLQITAGSANMLNDINILTGPQERELKEFNGEPVDYGKYKSVIELFEEQAARTPRATAVIFEDESLTYKELNEKSNQLAHYLVKQGVKAETLVPICVERSISMIVGILGIIKAGGAYVPVDPDYPQERITYILEDTGVKLALSTTARKAKLGQTKVIELDGDREIFSKEASSNPNIPIKPSQLAYMIYTSGSTGKPKGAMNEHGGIVNRLLWTQDYFKLTHEDAVLQKTTFSFDVSVWELFWPIITGARLVFAKPNGQADSTYLKEIIGKENITLLHFVPPMLTAFLSDVEPRDCKSLKHVLCSGEALHTPQVQLFNEKLPTVQLHNLYGPTEAAIDVSCWSYDPKEAISIVPIGRPVANTRLYILNQEGQLSSIGVPGELYIGGVQVGRGYLNKPELTTAKFIKDPFSNDKKARLYKTGDLVRWQLDGNIEYMGRIDDQVKIRGHRIELGEIESVLNENETISQAVVLARADKQGSKQLVGYVVATNQKFDKQRIQNYLKEKLPEYMVPALWVALDSIPLTSNGKINKKALPDPELTDSTVIYTAPRNETELALANIWKELLGVERVGVYDNFFELGGHSILVMRAVSSIRREFSITIPVDMLFQFTCISDLSKYLEIQTTGNLQEKETDEFDVVNI